MSLRACTETNPANTLVSGLWPPELGEKTFLIRHQVRSHLLQQPEETDTAAPLAPFTREWQVGLQARASLTFLRSPTLPGQHFLKGQKRKETIKT